MNVHSGTFCNILKLEITQMSVKIKVRKVKWFIHLMEYYIAIRTNELRLPHIHSIGRKELAQKFILY